MEHSFDIDIATEYGINAAILLNHISFWIDKNEANKTNFHDGYYWTYNSKQALKKLFPYMGEKQIRNAQQKLIDGGLIIKGNYSTGNYSRTTWYALTEKGKRLLSKGQNGSAERAEGLCQKGRTITDIYITDINTDKNIYCRVIEYLNEKAGKHYRTSKSATSHIKARISEGATIDDFKTVIDKKSDEWLNTDMEQYLRPETLFGTKFDGYLNQPTKKPQSKRSEEPQMNEQQQAEFDEWYKANVTRV